MKRLLGNRLIAVAVAALVFAVTGSAEEPAKKAAPVKYIVHAGNCSRSIKTVGTHENLWDAFATAEEARKDHKIVRVTTGKTDGLPHLETPKTCTVYSRGCKKQSWDLAATTRGGFEAETLSEAIRKKGDLAEVVYHLGEK